MNETTPLESIARTASLCPHDMSRWTGGTLVAIRNRRTGTIIGAAGNCPACGGWRRQMFDTDPRQYARKDRRDVSHDGMSNTEEAA